MIKYLLILLFFTCSCTFKTELSNEKLYKINYEVNQYEYVSDLKQFGVSDYWQLPYDTVTSNSGDCEDLAMAKAYSLRSRS